MLPKLPPNRTRSMSAPTPLPSSGTHKLGSNPNPMGLQMDHSPKMSPLPSPKLGNQHIGQLVPMQQIALENAKDPNPKRIQLVQLQIKSDGVQIENNDQNLKAKVKDVFDAFALIHQENMVDNRKGTVPVYTLPEFFWSDFGSTLTEDQQNMLVQEITARAQGDEFEGAVFVLGTMVISKPPESMTTLHQSDMQKIQQQLGDLSQLTNDDQINFTETYTQALDHGIEDCSTDQHEARALLATVGDMMEARLKEAGIEADTPLVDFGGLDFDRDATMNDVLKQVKTMATHREALMLMSTTKKLPAKSKMDKVIAAVAKNDIKGAKKLLTSNFDPAIKPHQLSKGRIEALANLFKAVGSGQKTLSALTSDFRKFYFSKSANTMERNKFNQRVGKMKSKHPKLGDPSTMYKLTENKAMVIEGGKGGKVGFTQKLLPSHADSPSYFENRESDTLVPQKLQSASIIANPKQESDELHQQIQDHQIDDSNFVFNSPKTGIDLGVAICRDYIGGVYKEHFDDSIKGQIDHLQIVAAGVPKIYPNQGSAKTSIGLNDGHSGNSQFVTKADMHHKGGRDLRTDIVEYNPQTQKFKFMPQGIGFEKKGMSLDDKSFAVGISRPTHLVDHNKSSLGSFQDDTNVGTVKLMEKMVKEHESSISVWGDLLATTEPLFDAIAKDVSDIDEIKMKLTLDGEAKDLFEKQNLGQVYESPLNHDELQQQLSKLYDKVAPWIDQVNDDPLLLIDNGDKKYDKTDATEVKVMLRKKVESLKGKISNSEKIVKYNKEGLDRITADRLRFQNQPV